MRGVVFTGDRELELREFPDPTPGPDEVIVAIKASGMCGSDLHSHRQPRSVRRPDKQCIAGHEPCGVVAVLDTSGSPDGRNADLKAVRIWGQVCFVGIGPDTTFGVNDDIIHKQLSVYGSWTFSTVDQAECAQFVVDHKLPLGAIFSHRYNSLDRAAEAYKLFDTQTTGKGVFLL
jgi:threonine dehydrogenase-like Zn-dependent dehydrogenase